MDIERKRRMKAFVIRWELTLYVIVICAYFGMMAATWLLFPHISTLGLAIIQLLVGALATLAAMASALKSDDTLK